MEGMSCTAVQIQNYIYKIQQYNYFLGCNKEMYGCLDILEWIEKIQLIIDALKTCIGG